MIKRIHILLLLGAILCACSPRQTAMATADDVSLAFADSLLALMSTEEKVGQMTNLSLMALAEGEFWDRRDTVILDTAKMRTYIAKYGVGSFQNLGTYPFSPEEWRKNIDLIQKYASAHTRLGIPLLYGIDAVHGANYSAGSTMVPHQIGLAATRNRALVEEVARITAYEVRASEIHWNYAPVLDVAQHAMWGRSFETFGEDPYLVGELGVAIMDGSLDDSLSSPYSSLACLKHFLAYGAPHSGKDRAPVYMPEYKLHEEHLPPFEKAINAGALTVMLGSHSLNGVPCHANSYLIQNLLKEKLAFKGFVISDWNDVDNLVSTHQIAKDEREAVKLAVNAGMDMCMEPYDASFAEHLIDLVDSGEVSMDRVDDAVRRILFVKHRLGLFEQVQSDAQAYPKYGGEEFAEIAYQAAVESITLLKNEKDLLPLKKDERVLVTGYASHSINVLNGAWSRTWLGRDTSYNDIKPTIKDAIAAEVGTQNIVWSQGTDYAEDINTEKTVQLAQDVDRIIICLGELPATEKPSDIDELSYPEAQLNLVRALAKTGKPISLVLVQGRPRTIVEVEPLADAILLAYLPGNEGGRAIADVLFGIANPSGKLPFTYPRYAGSALSYYHTKADTRDAGFGFEGFKPQYEFGHGLSYTQFAYSELELPDTIEKADELSISLVVTNIGLREGKETVELYVSDLAASLVPSVKVLRGFEKISLAPGQSQQVNFKLSEEDLGFINHKLERTVEPGDFLISAGGLEGKVHLVKSDHKKDPKDA